MDNFAIWINCFTRKEQSYNLVAVDKALISGSARELKTMFTTGKNGLNLNFLLPI